MCRKYGRLAFMDLVLWIQFEPAQNTNRSDKQANPCYQSKDATVPSRQSLHSRTHTVWMPIKVRSKVLIIKHNFITAYARLQYDYTIMR